MKHYYKRKLPHIIVDGYAYFVTSRLKDSLPKSVFEILKNEYDNSLRKISTYNAQDYKAQQYKQLKSEYFLKYDTALEQYKKSPQWLADENIAKLVKETLIYRDDKDYKLIAFTIMPNHIHIVFIPQFEKLTVNSEYNDKYPIGGLMGSIKKYIALNANKILNRRGSFWQDENYDHVIRNSNELSKVVKYVLQNPVKAGLAETPDKFKWNYINPNYIK
ncbi:MAG: transposase [Ignavibacteriaceae bacterium]|nr:transposase [Ignavibacteriaceae bacterium]